MRLHPQSGWPQVPPPEGGSSVGKSPIAFLSYRTRIPLDASQGPLITDVLLYDLFVQTNCAHAVSTAPEVQRVTRLFPRSSRWIRTALLPLMKPIANATLCFGGMLRHMWMWSGSRCPSNTSIPRCRHSSLITSPTRFFICPYSFLFRYFGMITTWYLHSHRAWDKLCQSCIGSFSFPFEGLSRRKDLFHFTPDR